MKQSKKVISILLVITIMVTLFPTNMYAAKKPAIRTINIYVCDNCYGYMDQDGKEKYDYDYWKENHKRNNGEFFNMDGSDRNGHPWREYYYRVNFVLKEKKDTSEYEGIRFRCPYKLDFTEKKDLCRSCREQKKYNKWNTYYLKGSNYYTNTKNDKANRMAKKYKNIFPNLEFPEKKLDGLVFFYDQKLDGTALSDRQVNVSWTKCNDADGYEVLVSTKVTQMTQNCEIKAPEEKSLMENDRKNACIGNLYEGVRFDDTNTVRQVITKNTNSTTITLPNPVNDVFTSYYGVSHLYKYENSNEWTVIDNKNWIQNKTTYTDSLDGAFFIRYRAYKIVNKKKIWSDWSQIKLVVPMGKNLKQMYEDLWIDNRGTTSKLAYDIVCLDAFRGTLERDYFLNDNVRRLKEAGINIE